MSGFKDTTRTVRGHHNWGGGSVGSSTGGTINRLARGGSIDKIDSDPGHPEIYPKEGNRTKGTSATLRKESPTQELEEHGGKTPLISKFKKGGATKHFHVHKHFHAKGGRTRTVSRSYSTAEKQAETYADGGHVHDDTHIPAGYPDYKKGGKTRAPVKKNAGGAMYAPGGAVGAPVMGGPTPSPLSALAARPRGLPMRPQLPMRRPVAAPGPQLAMRARGGAMKK
jgi:hypothetical protein